MIPYARRADAIRGTLEFAREMMLVRDYVLPKPWGPRARVGMLYSWATARRRVWDPSLRDKSGDYHAAMKYLHWNFDVIPSHMAGPTRLRAYGLLVAGGIDHVEPELIEGLTRYVRGGGALVVGEGAMSADLYGKPTGAERLLGVRVKGRHSGVTGTLQTVGLPGVELIPGEIRVSAGASDCELLPGTETLSTDADGRPMVTRRDLGRGRVYYIAADLIGYPLSKLLASIRAQCGPRPALEIADGTTGQLAPNILVSRRSYESHHALILMNRDAFPKLVRVRIRDLKGDWYVSDPLSGRRFTPGIGGARWTSSQIAAEGILYAIAAENRAVLLLTRRPWTGSALSDVNGAAARSAFEAELKAWKDGRKKEDAPFAVDPSRVIYVDLKGVANATKDDVVRDAPDRWLGFPFTEPLVRTFAGVPFQIIRWDHNAMKGYVALKSAATPWHPAAVRRIRVRGRARRIFFLHAAGEGRDGETLGTYTVRYVDGSTADIPIVVGRTIARLGDRVRGGGTFDKLSAAVLSASKGGVEMATGLVAGAGSAWHVTQWRNPEPGKAMASLDVTASPEASGTIVLVALTVQR